MKIVENYNYLGILVSSSGDVCSARTYRDFFDGVKSRAERRLACVNMWGFSEDGLRPAMCIKLYKGFTSYC